MIITKYEHACIVIEEQNKKIVIDPGVFSKSLDHQSNVVAVIVTHYHDDHIDKELVGQILADNEGAMLVSTQQVLEKFPDLPVAVMVAGEGLKIDPFTLEFCGGEHAVIHPSRPGDQNIGVLVNDAFYYPGDSFAKPTNKLKILAAPAAAPWLKINEAMDFLGEVKPEIAIPTHDAILSDEGKQIHDTMLNFAAEQAGVKYRRLNIGESMTI